MLGHDLGALHGLSHLIFTTIYELGSIIIIMIMPRFSDEEAGTGKSEEIGPDKLKVGAAFQHR